jgi:hypothetical protein
VNDLTADLLADLAGPPVAAAQPVVPVAAPERSGVTPVLSATVTPLRWSRPRVVRAQQGAGRGVRLGPLLLEVAVRP